MNGSVMIWAVMNVVCFEWVCYERRRVARGGNCSPIPKVALTIFKLIKLLMCKPKRCVSANQRKPLYMNFFAVD